MWWMRTCAALLLAIGLLPLSEPAKFATENNTESDIPVTEIYAGEPPVRYMGNRAATVSFGTISHCGEPPKDHHFVGCVRPPLVHMPNPCDYRDEDYARWMCHEMAHVNGWPATHGP